MMIMPIVKVPDSHVKFAEAVAAVAKEHGLRSFHMEYSFKDWDESLKDVNSNARHTGKTYIDFRSVDGRGRESVGLSIYAELASRLTLINEAESSS